MFEKFSPYILFAVGLALIPQFFSFDEMTNGHSHAYSDDSAPPIARSIEPLQTKSATSGANGRKEVRIRVDGSGHFRSAFEINGRKIEGMIDTGSTYVAMNQSTARSLGIKLAPTDFIHKALTANGNTNAALATLKRVEIGSISIRDVEAFILDDKALSSTLIGMSFMSELSSFRFENSELILTQ